jgi:multidrug efflux pump subunit AcrA (membrane-fusion protein)
MRRRYVLINGLLVLALVGAGATAVLAVGDPSPTTAAATPTATVSRGTVTATVSASGNLSAETTIGVNFPANSGTVTAIIVKAGDTVTAGQALAAADDTSAKLSLASAQANLASAKAQLASTTQKQTAREKASAAAQVRSAQVAVNNASTGVRQAQSTYSRDKTTQDALVKAAQDAYNTAVDAAAKATAKSALTQAKNTRSSTLLRDSQAIQTARGQVSSASAALSNTKASTAVNAQGARAGSIASAKAQIASAQAQVDQAQVTLDQTTLRAPVDGTVISIAGTVGGPSSAGSASSTSSSTSGFVVLSSMSHLQVTSMVAEADAAKVALGQPATVTFSALNETAAGTVTAMDLASTVNNNVVEYGVTVSLADAPKDLRLGQTASVSITTGTKADVLTVPSSAISKVGPLTTVTVRKDGKDTPTQVQTGLVGDSGTEITSGLSEGDVVVLSTSSGVPGGFTFPGGGLPGGISRGLGQ